MEMKKKRGPLFGALLVTLAVLLAAAVLGTVLFLSIRYARETVDYLSWKEFEATKEVVEGLWTEKESPPYKTYHGGYGKKEIYYPFNSGYFSKSHSVVIVKRESDGKETYALLYDAEAIDNPYSVFRAYTLKLNFVSCETNDVRATVTVSEEEPVSSFWSPFLETKAKRGKSEALPYLVNGHSIELQAGLLRFVLCETKDGLVFKADTYDGAKSFFVPYDAEAFDPYVNYITGYQRGGDTT